MPAAAAGALGFMCARVLLRLAYGDCYMQQPFQPGCRAPAAAMRTAASLAQLCHDALLRQPS